MATIKLTCEQAIARFFSYLDRALHGGECEQVEEHLEECLACCERLAFTKDLDAFVKTRLPESSVPPALAARIRGAIREASVEREKA
jgi:mycothiol system anti-sigma-R factor